ncbi:MAG: hypothetical protein HOV79_27865 [Hamadaea sp.]|nr:hypothetical protein [Hamadaea sp.]
MQSRWRFNPPPGWPVPPQGWVPPAGWSPDPSWPPAPAGWVFWVAATVTPPVPMAPGPVWPTQPHEPAVSTRSGLATAAKIAAGVLSLILTIAATWIAFIGLPERYTAEQWRERAVATCQRDFADVRLSLNGVLLKVAQAMAAMPPPGQVDAGMTDATTSVGELARAFRRFSADLREIKVPGDLARADLDLFLTSTEEIATGIEQVGDLMVNYQLGKATPEQMEAAMTTLTALSGDTIPQWQQHADRLGLSRCLPGATAAG